MKIAFLIRSLEIGGAERQLIILAKALKQLGHQVSVIVFYSGGTLEKELLESDIPLFSLEKKHRYDIWGWLKRYYQTIQKINPDILHSYLTVANLLSLMIKPFCSKLKIVWGIRASNMDLRQYDWLSRGTHWLEARLSRWTDHIIVNAEANLVHMKEKGYFLNRTTVIFNGIDTERFRPNLEWREKYREAWKILPTDILIGLVGRFDPMKDHATFFRAAKMMVLENEKVRFVCVGGGTKEYKAYCRELVEKENLKEKVFFLESKREIEEIYNALDLLCSSSAFGEGFSNVIAEAMATGCAAVVTDVGDSGRIVGKYGKVVPARNAEALAEGCLWMIGREDKEDKEKIRKYIVENYSQKIMVERTEEVLKTLQSIKRDRLLMD